MKNWKTTTAGVLSIVGGCSGLYFAYKTGQLSQEVIIGSTTAIMTGIGLIFAKDSNITGGTVKQ